MNNVQTIINQYLDFCQYQKRLNTKTLKAYRIDLKQFSSQLAILSFSAITSNILEAYISTLHITYLPKSVLRIIASIKALFHYLENKNML